MPAILNLIILLSIFSCNSHHEANKIVSCVINEVQTNLEIKSYFTKDTIVLKQLSDALKNKKEIEERKYVLEYIIDITYESQEKLHIETTGLVFIMGNKYYECNLMNVINKIKSNRSTVRQSS